MDHVKYSREFDSDEGFDKLKYLAEARPAVRNEGQPVVLSRGCAGVLCRHCGTARRARNARRKRASGSPLSRSRLARPGERAQLNDELNQVLDEHQIFRIDHYLGKETVQNILVFRFGNGIFEPSGIATMSTMLRLRRRNRSVSRVVGRSMKRPGRCVTFCRTT